MLKLCNRHLTTGATVASTSASVVIERSLASRLSQPVKQLVLLRSVRGPVGALVGCDMVCCGGSRCYSERSGARGGRRPPIAERASLRDFSRADMSPNGFELCGHGDQTLVTSVRTPGPMYQNEEKKRLACGLKPRRDREHRETTMTPQQHHRQGRAHVQTDENGAVLT